MKCLLLVTILCVILLDQAEAGCKPLPISSAVKKKKLEAFTQMKNKKPVADSPCWWDPMHKYCQSPKSKTVGLLKNSNDMNL